MPLGVFSYFTNIAISQRAPFPFRIAFGGDNNEQPNDPPRMLKKYMKIAVTLHYLLEAHLLQLGTPLVDNLLHFRISTTTTNADKLINYNNSHRFV